MKFGLKRICLMMVMIFIAIYPSLSAFTFDGEEINERAREIWRERLGSEQGEARREAAGLNEDAEGRSNFQYWQRAYPFDEIPREAQLRMLEYRRKRAEARAEIGPAVTGSEWLPFGPAPISVNSVLPQYSGRVTAVAIDQNNSNIFYLGGANGGVWKSTNAGQSWRPLTDFQPTLTTGSLALDPTNSNTLYVGTGESFSGAAYFGAGVLKSTDGGNTFIQLAANTFFGGAITSLVIDPTNPQTLYAASGFSLAGLNDGGGQPQPTTGFYKSFDGGVNWALITSLPAGGPFNLKMDPNDSQTLYASYDFTFDSNFGGPSLFKTIDGGTSWTQLQFPITPFSGMSIAVSKSTPNTLYVAFDDGSGQVSILKSIDGGVNWTVIPRPINMDFFFRIQGSYDNVLAVSPIDSNIIIFGGVFTVQSEDGGLTWNSNFAHPDAHAIEFAPTNPNRVLLGNDGGVYLSDDAGKNLDQINNTLALTQFTTIAVHPTNGNFVLGGTQDNGTLIRTNSNIWKESEGGDSFGTMIDFKNPQRLYHGFFGRTYRRSDDGGVTWVDKMNGLGQLGEFNLFYSPTAMDPVNPLIIYFGSSRLYRSTNGGDSWAATNPTELDDSITAIGLSAVSPQRFYISTLSSGVKSTTNGGATFQNVNTGLPLRYTTRLVVDPANANLVYACFSGFGNPHVFKTINGGLSWTDISGNLPDNPVNALVIDKSAANKLYVATDLGVFVTIDGGLNWQEVGPNSLPNTSVLDLKLNNTTNTLLAGTHGRGVFKLDTTAGALPVTITSFTPTSGLAGARVTITGTGFKNGTLNNAINVQINGSDAVFTINSATSISATVPAAATTGKITVVGPNNTATSALDFKVTPKINSFTPTSGFPNTDIVDLFGSGIANPSSVKLNNISAQFFIISPVQVRFVVPAGATTGRISVTTDGGTALSSTVFTVVGAPKITAFSPLSGAPGATVTISGSNFIGVTNVIFGGISATFTPVTSTSLRAVVPVGAQTGNIVVINPAGFAVSTGIFKILPAITGFSPTAGLPGSAVVVTGSGFFTAGITAVRFNNVTAASFTIDSDTQLTAVVPATATTGKISLVTPAGTVLSTNSFTVIKPPVISGFTPVSGAIGALVTISGANFIGSTDVRFNGVSTSFTIVSATSIKANVPSGATTGKISVVNPAGTATSAANFTVIN